MSVDFNVRGQERIDSSLEETLWILAKSHRLKLKCLNARFVSQNVDFHFTRH